KDPDAALRGDERDDKAHDQIRPRPLEPGNQHAGDQHDLFESRSLMLNVQAARRLTSDRRERCSRRRHTTFTIMATTAITMMTRLTGSEPTTGAGPQAACRRPAVESTGARAPYAERPRRWLRGRSARRP